MSEHSQSNPHSQAQVLERGNIYFIYRPKVNDEDVHGLGDVQRTYMILEPQGGEKRYRLVVVGDKKLPEIQGGGQKFWGYVESVAHKPETVQEELKGFTYHTKTRGDREQPAARPAGEGVYEIVRHDDHTHLAYALELPEKPGEVQQALNIEEEASYIFSIKNPELGSPRNVGLSKEEKADFPEELQAKFHGRRFIDAEPELLDHKGCEILLIGATEDPEGELGIKLDPEHESEHSAEVFSDLRLNKAEHPVEPLLKGQWR